MLSAAAWGLAAASSLLIGAVLALVRRWPDSLIGAVLGFGAGALIASVSFELAEEGVRSGGPWSVAVRLAVGALTFFFADRAVNALALRAARSAGGAGVVSGGGAGGGEGGAAGGGGTGAAGGAGATLALGALLDGGPEQLVLGIGLAQGDGLSLALLVDTMIPEAQEKERDKMGLFTVVGFALSAGLSLLS